METRARYVLVGAVTVLSILAGLGFFLWLAKVQLDRAYARYDILFESVEGLGVANPVRYNGVDVGQVLTINLNRADPSQVRVGIEVAAVTPIRQGTIAKLQAQGVTGVSFVSLAGGLSVAPLLEPDPLTGVPVIPSEVSAVQGLIEDAPDLLKEAIALLKDLSAFTTDENRESVANILKNVDQATGRLDEALTNFAEISDRLSVATDKITDFTTRLETVADNADAALVTANRALRNIDRYSETGLPKLSQATTDAGELMDALTGLVKRIERDPARFLLGNRTPEYNQ